MDDLIKALQIFRKYDNHEWPTHCNHDVLHVIIDPDDVTTEDIKILDGLGFIANDDDDGFISYRFGSA